MKKKSFLEGGILDNKISNPPAPAFAIWITIVMRKQERPIHLS